LQIYDLALLKSLKVTLSAMRIFFWFFAKKENRMGQRCVYIDEMVKSFQ